VLVLCSFKIAMQGRADALDFKTKKTKLLRGGGECGAIQSGRVALTFGQNDG
jgi:hypothetical protein